MQQSCAGTSSTAMDVARVSLQTQIQKRKKVKPSERLDFIFIDGENIEYLTSQKFDFKFKRKLKSIKATDAEISVTRLLSSANGKVVATTQPQYDSIKTYRVFGFCIF